MLTGVVISFDRVLACRVLTGVVALSVKAEADEVSSTREAKQLAYCLFWNVRPPDTDR